MPEHLSIWASFLLAPFSLRGNPLEVWTQAVNHTRWHFPVHPQQLDLLVWQGSFWGTLGLQ